MKTGLRRLMTLLMTLLFVLNTVSVGFATETNYSESISLESILPEVEPTDGDAAPAAEGDETVTEGETEETAEGDEDVVIEMVNIVIEYKKGNEVVAQPWSASIAKGETLNTTIANPEIVGYVPTLTVIPDGVTFTTEAITLALTNVQESLNIVVQYQPGTVNYTVRYYQQSLDNPDVYEEVASEAKTGTTESVVPLTMADVENKYPGFTALLFDTPTIAADGSTVVEVYYDRNYVLMTFDLGGGYGVEPIYDLYGATLPTVGTPTYAGYTFQGWSLDGTSIVELPATMPAENVTYKAVWQAAESVKVTVVYWGENADDEGYSYIDSSEVTAKPGDEITYTDLNLDAHTHTEACRTCGMEEHSHTSSCYGYIFIVPYLKCGYEEHTHSDTCNRCVYNEDLWYFVKSDTITVAADGSSVMNVYFDRKTFTMTFRKEDSETLYGTITDKWGAKITDRFNAMSTTAGTSSWSRSSDGGEPWTALVERMPTEDRTYYAHTASGTCTAYYYFEDLDGNYVQKFSVAAAGSNLNVTDEDRPEIEGFECNVSKGTQNGDDFDGAKFYYDRLSYNLVFNNGYENVKTESVKYEAPLSTYEDYVPTLPTEIYEAGAYTFGGWYLNPECTGEEYDLSAHTMPAANVLLYAKWVPITHTVKVYLDSTKTEQLGDTQIVDHRALATEPELPEGHKYEDWQFVGWFYVENGVEKAFGFDSMGITKDMEIYAKWSSKVPVEYTFYYKLDSVDGVDVAAPTTGSALAGISKTQEAKVGEELYAEYQTGYFPNVKSHTITVQIGVDNVYYFIYTKSDPIPYTVRYVNAETGETLLDDKVVSDNMSAVVTEKFVRITGYMPDAYQKRLVVSTTGENVITFYYTPNTTQAYVLRTWWIQNPDGVTYSVYREQEEVGNVNSTYTIDEITINGFVENTDHAERLIEDTLTTDGLHLQRFYDRKAYPYVIRYLEKWTNVELATPDTGSAPYGSLLNGTAKTIPGYTLDSVTPSASITIQIENPETVASKNIITFYYTENQVTYNYYVVGPAGLNDAAAGSVSLATETIASATGDPEGSTATANANYKFVGWFKDEACTDPVGESDATLTDNHLDPLKNADGIYTGGSFYAKFVLDTTTVTIEKIVAGNMGDRSKTFEFTYSATRVGETTAALTGTFPLNHLGTQLIENVPIGATLIITETNAAGYTITAEASKGEVNCDKEKYTVTATVAADTGKITITNTLDGTPDTGILLDSLPYVLILAVVGAALVLWFIRKRRVED